MTTEQTTARESRSVRLNEYEWATAEAIARISRGVQGSAGAGLRRALEMAEDALTEQGHGSRLDQARNEVLANVRLAGGQ
jgi:hypothetical protein